MTSNNSNNNTKQQQQQQQQQVAAAAAAAAAAHINPFYIDPGELEKEWQGDDYEWEDEYEAEGLLSTSCSDDHVENGSQQREHHQHHSRSSSPRQSSAAINSNKKKKNDSAAAAASSSKNSRRQHVVNKGGVRQLVLSRGQKRWICIIGFFALVIFVILSSTSNNNSNNNIMDNNNDDDDETNQHDNNNNNAAAAAAINDNNDNDDAVSVSVDEPPPPVGGGNHNIHSDDSIESFVHRVVMLGERQTGVDAFRKHWADCFPTRNFTTFLTRKTYWFQDLTHPPPEVSSENKNSNKKEERILFVLLVRNPYTWVEAMRGHPVYMSAHVNQTTHKALSWQDFVTRPWMPLTTTEDSSTATPTTTTCQLDFAPNQVMPCHVPTTGADLDDASAHPADVYELKPAAQGVGIDSGSSSEKKKNDLAFANILALRAAKLQHFISDLPQAYQDFNLMASLPLKSSTRPPMQASTSESLIDNNVLIIHYEDDLVLSMQKLEQVTGWKPIKSCRQAKRFPPTIKLENLDPEYIQFLSQDSSDTGLYWELEALIGYQKAAL